MQPTPDPRSRSLSIRSRPIVGTTALVWWSCLLFCAILGSARAEPAVSKEYQLKAAFIYNFTKFVEWPEHSFANAESPIVIGILRGNPFNGELRKAVSGRKVNGRSIVVTQVTSTATARQVHILFVGAALDSRLKDFTGVLDGSTVLTVGESPAFARYGGMITFTLRGDSLRFVVNIDSAKKAGLKISSQLQKLGVRPEGGAQ